MLGSPSEDMGTVTVPGVLLVTTTTCPAVFWKVAWAPTPVKTAAVGLLLSSVWNCTEELEVAATHTQSVWVHAHQMLLLIGTKKKTHRQAA